jgi:acetyltransferase
MVRRPAAQELILGVARDPVFGPVILFGAGGVAVELLHDTAVALPPLDAALADDLIAQTRAGLVLAGFRGRPAADAEALQSALVALSHMIEDLPAIRAMDVNPVLADADGVIALDARIEIDPDGLDRPAPNPDLAIRPYPAAWKGTVAIKGGTVTIRPILPVDAHLYRDFLARLDPEDIRMRFMAPRKHFPDDMGLRLSQLDYDRDMAFVAIDEAGGLAGVSRMACDPDRVTAEYALIVRSDLGGRGIGTALMTRLIDYARAEGVQRLDGMILSENRGMRALVTRLGFTIEPMVEEPGVVMSSLAL